MRITVGSLDKANGGVSCRHCKVFLVRQLHLNSFSGLRLLQHIYMQNPKVC